MHFISKINTWKWRRKSPSLNHWKGGRMRQQKKHPTWATTLKEEMRDETTQHYSLKPQVHRQSKCFTEGISVGLLVFLKKDTLRLRAIYVWKRSCLEKQKRHFLRWLWSCTQIIGLIGLAFKGFASAIAALYCPCLTKYYFHFILTNLFFVSNHTWFYPHKKNKTVQ